MFPAEQSTEKTLSKKNLNCGWRGQYLTCAIVQIANYILIFAEEKGNEQQVFERLFSHMSYEIQLLNKNGVINIGSFSAGASHSIYANVHGDSIYVANSYGTDEDWVYATTVFKRFFYIYSVI